MFCLTMKSYKQTYMAFSGSLEKYGKMEITLEFSLYVWLCLRIGMSIVVLYPLELYKRMEQFILAVKRSFYI